MAPWLLLTFALTTAPPTVPPEAVASASSPSDGTATVSPVTAAAALAPSADVRSDFDFTAGTSIAGGDFGSARDTSIVATAIGARARLGDLRLSASIPYMRIRSAGLVVTGIDSTPVVISGDTGGRRHLVDGIGDLTLGASYTVARGERGPEFELSGRVKLPTASQSSGLSTNRTDYSVGAQVTQPIGRIAPFASLTYRIFGDSADLRLRDGFAASAGASWAVGSKTVLLASYHYAATASRLVRDAHELFAGASRAIAGSRLRLSAFATAGLSQGAAAASGGIGISVSL